MIENSMNMNNQRVTLAYAKVRRRKLKIVEFWKIVRINNGSWLFKQVFSLHLHLTLNKKLEQVELSQRYSKL